MSSSGPSAIQDMGVEAFRCKPDQKGGSSGKAGSPRRQTSDAGCATHTTAALHTLNGDALVTSSEGVARGPGADGGESSALLSQASGVDHVAANGQKPGGVDEQSLPGGRDSELVASTSGADSHCGAVISLALCGQYVCSAGSDAMIKVWEAGSLKLVR